MKRNQNFNYPIQNIFSTVNPYLNNNNFYQKSALSPIQINPLPLSAHSVPPQFINQNIY